MTSRHLTAAGHKYSYRARQKIVMVRANNLYIMMMPRKLMMTIYKK